MLREMIRLSTHSAMTCSLMAIWWRPLDHSSVSVTRPLGCGAQPPKKYVRTGSGTAIAAAEAPSSARNRRRSMSVRGLLFAQSRHAELHLQPRDPDLRAADRGVQLVDASLQLSHVVAFGVGHVRSRASMSAVRRSMKV